MHLAFVFALGNDMTHMNDKKNNNNRDHLIAATAAAATISTLAIAIMVASTSMTTTPVAATTTAASNATATIPSSSSGIELSAQPIYQERSPEPNITPINQTHAILTFSGNGTLTLPNSTQTINTTGNGTALISFATPSGYGKETIRTQDGETATLTLYEIVQFNPAAPAGGGGKGIVTAVFQTNSTGTLAPLNGMIAAGIDDMTSSGESHVTLWRWESGIGNINNSTGVAAPPPPSTNMQGEPSVNSSNTTTTNELPPAMPLTAP
jgi:hypothetical protein